MTIYRQQLPLVNIWVTTHADRAAQATAERARSSIVQAAKLFTCPLDTRSDGLCRGTSRKIVCAGNVRTNPPPKEVAPSLATHSSLSSIGSGQSSHNEAPLAEKELGCGSPPATTEHVAEAATQAACSLRQSGCRRPSCWRMAAARAAGLLLNAAGAMKPSVRPPKTCSAHQQQLTELLTSLGAIAAS